MRFVVISDTHGQHADLSLPEADGIIHAGDISKKGTLNQVQDFLFWFQKLDYQYKIFIAGNHDFFFERAPQHEVDELITDDLIYLNDSGVDINGVKIWGSPITPYFNNWAFNRQRGAEIKPYWDLIPEDTDVLITHGPPYGILDRTFFFKKVGCKELLDRVQAVKPRYHIFGHIHEANGRKEIDGVDYINASNLNLRYKLVNPPVLIDL